MRIVVKVKNTCIRVEETCARFRSMSVWAYCDGVSYLTDAKNGAWRMLGKSFRMFVLWLFREALYVLDARDA